MESEMVQGEAHRERSCEANVAGCEDLELERV